MLNQRVILIIIILILATGNIFLGGSYFFTQKELQITKQQLNVQLNSTKILNFTKLFIEKVLKADKEVSFEDRLKLETDVRDLRNEEILAQWNKFIASKTGDDAQNSVKDLLELLVKKIPY